MTCVLFVLMTSAPLFATQPNAEPTTASAKITLKDVAIGELLEKLNVKLDYRLEGQVTIVASMSVEIGNAWRNVAFPPQQQNELLAVSNHFSVAVGLAERIE